MDLSLQSNASLSQILQNVARALQKSPLDQKAVQKRSDVLEEWNRRYDEVEDGWTPGSQGDPRLLKADGVVVATVYRQETHRRDNAGVYVVIVKGTELPDRCRYIDDARAVAELRLAQGS